MSRRLISVRELHEQLGAWMVRRPECASWPVHLLDLDDRHDAPSRGLVTEMELDMFDDEVGMVVSLVAHSESGCVSSREVSGRG